jgi:hypothetical protein
MHVWYPCCCRQYSVLHASDLCQTVLQLPCLQALLTPLQRSQLQVLEALADTFDSAASQTDT